MFVPASALCQHIQQIGKGENVKKKQKKTLLKPWHTLTCFLSFFYEIAALMLFATLLQNRFVVVVV